MLCKLGNFEDKILLEFFWGKPPDVSSKREAPLTKNGGKIGLQKPGPDMVKPIEQIAKPVQHMVVKRRCECRLYKLTGRTDRQADRQTNRQRQVLKAAPLKILYWST